MLAEHLRTTIPQSPIREILGRRAIWSTTGDANAHTALRGCPEHPGSGQSLQVLVRSRTTVDIPASIGLLGEVHGSDGYPTHWPRDAHRFIAPRYERVAWVAYLTEELVGHIALHDPGGDPAFDHACAVTGLPAERLALVARLIVPPTERRAGIGTALLTTATKDALRQGLRPLFFCCQTVRRCHLALRELRLAARSRHVAHVSRRYDHRLLALHSSRWGHMTSDPWQAARVRGVAARSVVMRWREASGNSQPWL